MVVHVWGGVSAAKKGQRERDIELVCGVLVASKR